MKKLLRNPYAVAVLAAVALVLVIDAAIDGSPAPGTGSAAGLWNDPEEDEAPAVAARAAPATPIERAAIEALAATPPPRDPFGRDAPSAPGAANGAGGARIPDETFVIKGLWIQGDARLAAIDNAILRAGDRHKSATVGAIENDGVWLKSGARERFLKPGESWKVPPPQDNLPQL